MGQPAAWLAQWTGFIALAALIGAVALDLLVLPGRGPELAGPRARLRGMRLSGVAVFAAASAAGLLLRSATMSGSPGLAGAAAAVPPVLARTHFGAVWSVRIALLLLLLPTVWGRARGPLVGAAMLSLAVAATVTLTAHADDWGDLTATAALDWAHLVAASAWTGGLFALTWLGGRAAAGWPAAHLPAIARRFSRLAGCCLAVVVLTGAYRLWVELPAPSALWRTGYGRILAVKLLFVLALAGCGAVNRYLVLPRLGGRRSRGFVARLLRLTRLAVMGSRAAPSSRAARPGAAHFGTWLSREAALAVAVFWCTAMLVESTPARHAGHEGHAAAAAGPQRLTMAELHAAGGVPPGWRFSPPPGDAERGRALFARLGCPACHRVDGAGGPDARPGPDLTGEGEHHPAGYLLESVINPDAVIVKGPGYTGADGRSLMPSYADRLTVAELLDLVAYLQTL